MSDESVSRSGDRRSSAEQSKTEGRKAPSSEAASRVLERAKDAVLDTAQDQKVGGAERLAGLSRVVHEVADDLNREMPKVAGYVHAAADRLGEASSSLRNRNIEEIVESASGFARKQPMASFVGALVAGFALSRFLKSTSGTEAGARDGRL
jgi:hypothetical protein